MKIIIIIVIVLLILVIGIGGWFYYQSTQPFYKPGMVSKGERLTAPLVPPAQPNGAEAWLVEPGIELSHFAEGEGRNVLVIHGGPGAPFSEPVDGLSRLRDQYRFHYYAQRGCGESTRPFDRFESTNTYENMQSLEMTLGLGAQIADIERIRQILGDEKLILIGHSWGGFLASLYAAEFPERVEALNLVSPANVLVMPQPEAESDLFASVRSRLPVDQQAEFDDFMAGYMDFKTLFDKSENDLIALNEKFAEYYVSVMDEATVERAAQMPQQGQPGGWMVWAQYLSMGKQHDYGTALASVYVPVLVIHGADDMQSEAASRLYSDAFPNAEFVVIENASHFAFEEQSEAFTDAVSRFLGQ
jgi:proline iminopeptidase